jgi:hypothetical protein
MDYSASVGDRVPNTDHVALTLCLPVPGLSIPAIEYCCSVACRPLLLVLCWDSLKADAYAHERVCMREAGSFLDVGNACQEGDVELACGLLMRMAEQAARAVGADLTRLCRCPLRHKWSMAQQGVHWFDAECRSLRACYRHSRDTPRECACLHAQYHRLLRAKRNVFFLAKLAYSWPKSVLTVVLQ